MSTPAYFHPHCRAPYSLFARIWRFVPLVILSFGDGLIAEKPVQASVVAHPAIKFAINISVAIVANFIVDFLSCL